MYTIQFQMRKPSVNVECKLFQCVVNLYSKWKKIQQLTHSEH